jgi:acyl carrier protein
MEVQDPKVALFTISESKTPTTVEVRSASEIQAWMVSYLADLLEADPDELNVAIPFDRYGLDSSVAVGMTGDLENWLGTKLDPTLLYDYPTIESLAQHLADELKAK